MAQVGWTIWSRTRLFDEMAELIAFAEAAVERRFERYGGPDGAVTMVAWSRRGDGQYALHSISDWEKQLVGQVLHSAQHFDVLDDLIQGENQGENQ